MMSTRSSSYRRLLFLILATLATAQICASQTTIKLVQDKLNTLKSGIQENQAAVTLLTATAAYATYRKSSRAQATVESAWQTMKARSQELYTQYNKPVTVGFWARLGCLLVGGKYAYGNLPRLDRQEIVGFLKKSAEPIATYGKQIQEKINLLSPVQKIAAGIGLTSVLIGGGHMLKKIYTKFMRKDRKAAFVEFKSALTDKQRKNYAELIDRIEKDSQLFYTDSARDFLTELTNEQYILAEHVLESELR